MDVGDALTVKRGQALGMGVIPEGVWGRATLDERFALVDRVVSWMASPLSAPWPTSLRLACGHVVNWPLQSGDSVIDCRACR